MSSHEVSQMFFFVSLPNDVQLCEQCLIGNERKLASAGSEQILVDLLLNSNWKWKEICLGWVRADAVGFAIKF